MSEVSLSMIFAGRVFAHKIEKRLAGQVSKLVTRPRLVVIVDPANTAGMKYTALKQQVAKRLGVEFVISQTAAASEAKKFIEAGNRDDNTAGIMIQLPFPRSAELIPLIDPKKDVDGLREDSPFFPAVVRAVVEILKIVPGKKQRTLVIGNRGFVGSRLVKELAGEGMDVVDFDPRKIKAAEVVISCTGQPGLITAEMVKRGVVAIDVGFPRGDFAALVATKASFFTPVPGGVGPVTVVMLFQNLLGSN